MLSSFRAVLVLGSAVALVACGGAGTASGPSSSDGGGSATSVGGQLIDVHQLIARSADTPVAVRGLLHVTAGVARLCGAVLESYPVQCGKPSVELVGLDLSSVDGVTTAEGVTWKEGAVLDLERVGDGRFAVVGNGARASVRVVLGLYSGVPDPTWTLTAAEASELAGALARLTRINGTTSPGGLGYHGFSIVG